VPGVSRGLFSEADACLVEVDGRQGYALREVRERPGQSIEKEKPVGNGLEETGEVALPGP
jgi:hypothetical protein